MVIAQGDIWWADFGEPAGSEAGYRRPMMVIQSDALNSSRLTTLLCVPLSSSMRWVNAAGNVLLRASDTGLRHDSLALVMQIAAINRAQLIEHVRRVSRLQLNRVFKGIDTVLGR